MPSYRRNAKSRSFRGEVRKTAKSLSRQVFLVCFFSLFFTGFNIDGIVTLPLAYGSTTSWYANFDPTTGVGFLPCVDVGGGVYWVNLAVSSWNPLVLSVTAYDNAASCAFTNHATYDIATGAGHIPAFYLNNTNQVYWADFAAVSQNPIQLAVANYGLVNTTITGRVILFATTNAASNIYVPPGIPIDTSKQNLLRYFPDLGLVDVVGWNTSYSYAPSSINPYTVDNRLFSLDQWGSWGTGGAGGTGVKELDPHIANDELLGTGPTGLPENIGCGPAVVGTTIYYISASRYDIFEGWVGNDFREMDLTTGKTTTLLKSGDPDLPGCDLASSNGTLYDSKYYPATSSTDYVLELHKRDLTTGKTITALTQTWTISETASYKGPWVTFDGDTDTAYVVYQDKSSKEIVILTFTFSGTEQQIFSQILPTIDSVYYVQVIHGHLAIGQFGGNVFLYDTSTGAGSTVYMPFGYYAMQMLYLTQ